MQALPCSPINREVSVVKKQTYAQTIADDEDLRATARRLFKVACAAVDPKVAVCSAMTFDGEKLVINNRELNMSEFDEVILLACGKASVGMAEGVEQVLGDRVTRGVVVTKYDHSVGHKLSSKLAVYEANHPTPDEASIIATRALLEMARKAGKRSLVICCISGGTSALLEELADGILLSDMVKTTQRLLACGCTIEEKNAVLKHLSNVKGGRLVEVVFPARMVTMILSDVIGDPLDAIGSGPTVPDSSTFSDCLDILRRYNIADTIPRVCYERLLRGVAGEISENPKEGDVVFEHTETVVVANNKTAVEAAAAEAKSLGFNTLVVSSVMEGEAIEMARTFAKMADAALKNQSEVLLPACIVMGGETTVTLPAEPGLGGRNQLMALAAASHIQGMKGVAFLAGGTDGGDGPNNDSAGAAIIGSDAVEAEKAGLNLRKALEVCDAYNFFKEFELVKYGCSNILHLRDGPTGTNVADVSILLVRDCLS